MSTLVLVLIAFFLPPLAVFLVAGLTAHFWINLVLFLLGWFPGVIHAVYVVGTKDGRRS